MMIRDKSTQDEPWIRALLCERWGGPIVVVHGDSIDAMALPALVAGDQMGLATYCLREPEAELVTLDAVEPRRGIGTQLVDALVQRLEKQGIRRLWVTTTNDNLAALGFYQKRGFRLQRLRAGAVEQARLIKPGIPLVAENGIPIRDEIDLCRDL
jgi:N-acetylglutamate synthase-like GNAT family acetyltransferase